MNQTLKFDGLKRHSPISFLSSYFIAIIDIIHIISKNILDNNGLHYTKKSTAILSTIKYPLFGIKQ